MLQSSIHQCFTNVKGDTKKVISECTNNNNKKINKRLYEGPQSCETGQKVNISI